MNEVRHPVIVQIRSDSLSLHHRIEDVFTFLANWLVNKISIVIYRMVATACATESIVSIMREDEDTCGEQGDNALARLPSEIVNDSN